MFKHSLLSIIVIFSIIMAALQTPVIGQPDDHRYVYVTDDGTRAWICEMTEATDECYLVDNTGGGYR